MTESATASVKRRVSLSTGDAQRPAGIGDRVRAGCLWALLLIAFWAPLPFGSARPWAWGLLAVLIGTLVVVFGVADIVAPEDEPPLLRPLRVPAILFALTLAWAIIQCLPWTPTSWQHPLWEEAAKLLPGQRVIPSISIDRSASRTAILRLLTYAGVFWLAYRCARQAHWARLLTGGAAGIAAIYAGWGLVIYWTGNRSVLWFMKWAYSDDLTSTFVNRNSFATYAGLAAVTMIGLLLDAIVRGIDFRQGRKAILRWLVELLTTRAAWLIGGIAISLTALLLTHSRGGAAATGVGILALLAMAFLVSGTTTLGRMADTKWDLEGRNEIYDLTETAIGNTPVLGTGFGTFKSVFPAYRTEDLELTVEMAHNDYLQNMLELGIPAALLLFAAVLVLVLYCINGALIRRRDAIMPCLGVGVTALVAFHSLFDFSLQIPAVTISYLLILGAGVAQSARTTARAGTTHLT